MLKIRGITAAKAGINELESGPPHMPISTNLLPRKPWLGNFCVHWTRCLSQCCWRTRRTCHGSRRGAMHLEEEWLYHKRESLGWTGSKVHRSWVQESRGCHPWNQCAQEALGLPWVTLDSCKMEVSPTGRLSSFDRSFLRPSSCGTQSGSVVKDRTLSRFLFRVDDCS